MSTSIRDILKHHPVTASAPCRIDSGGTWDIKALALPLELIEPVTINIALSLRTWVTLSPFKVGWVRISSEGISKGEQYHQENLPFNTPLGLYFAAVSHFGFHGLQVNIRSDSPVKSALGGSSTALIALIKALSKVAFMLGQKRLYGGKLLSLGYHMEDGISGGNCGMQDQAAAVYGGVNLWKWRYGKGDSLFKRERLLDIEGQKELSERILVAYSGESHVSARINRSWIHDFLSGKTRTGWLKANDIVHRLAGAIKHENWRKAASFLRDETAVRKEITPNALIPITEELIHQAETAGCGARFAGAGAGGSIWALGEIKKIRDLRKIWEKTLSPIKRAKILHCTVDPKGVR